ncbi:MAG: response regulator [Clostridiales bacterium]|nr:response regulator [Clostridiales bacterium]
MYRVIIVEDEPEIAKVTKNYIEKNADFKVKAIFSNGAEALNYIWLNTVDLIILDLYMPKMNGKEFLYRLRKENIAVDVIVVTAANDASNIRDVLPFGIIDYLLKPFEQVRFSETLLKYTQRREVMTTSNKLNQEAIDSMLLFNSVEDSADTEKLMDKGLQKKTYERIRAFMMESEGKNYTAECLSDEIGLSKVTIRRYMNYMIDAHEVASEVDYKTGGRPSIVYHYCGRD